ADQRVVLDVHRSTMPARRSTARDQTAGAGSGESRRFKEPSSPTSRSGRFAARQGSQTSGCP
ncbi:MAG: hypothetical protein LC799_28555, partial [Actinobacteria bacterium]|nr:hypothetical protein [Actinomycetota bacterium]